MPNIRRELPKGHWCETRDPWEVTERDVKAMRKSLPKTEKKAVANLAGRPPQLADQDGEEDQDIAEARGWHSICWVITGWGGELLDGKPVTPEVGMSLPLPLSTGIVKASNAFWREVNGEDPTEAP